MITHKQQSFHWILPALAGLALCFLPTATLASPYFGNGSKVGEVDSHSAIVWTRLTAEPEANFGLMPILNEGLARDDRGRQVGPMPVDVLPGAAGEVELTYWPDGFSASSAISLSWVPVDAASDHTAQIRITDLMPGTRYHYQLIAREHENDTGKVTLYGSFQTAPAADAAAPIRFVVTTCQAVRSIDAGAEGHAAYRSMLRFQPDFFVHTGDIVYYDKVPLAKNRAEARAKWNLMFAYRHNRDFHRQVTSYFIKDDHDTLKNDTWPGQRYGDLTFQAGLDIFREQVPMGDATYRSYRWGRDVQIWMTEHRDFRSANTLPDGPEKTILGAEQLEWLQTSIAASDATFKFLIVPGPIVGPDKPGKNDNHSNPGFQYEGQILQDFLSGIDNLYVITGDRHWQYDSIDPDTGLREFGCGPINDAHTFGGNPGYDESYHQYFDPGGGYLGITVDGETLRVQWLTAGLDANGDPIVRRQVEL